MTESLRALLSGAIDYAGLFPPAALPLEQALAKYRQHRAGPESWMLGRFVCPAGLLLELGSVYDESRDGKVVAVVPWGDKQTTKNEDKEAGRTNIGRFPVAGAIDVLEFRWQTNERAEPIGISPHNLIEFTTRMAMGTRAQARTLFLELPLRESASEELDWPETVPRQIAALVAHNLSATLRKYPLGFKLRCGGAEPGDVPSSVAVATAICACRDHGVFWKATAGLHHPFRHVDLKSGVPMHGFINLLTAAVMADAHRLEVDRVQAILEDDDPWHFRFTNEALIWHDLSATVPQIAAARERALRSFGSCSIEEPWQDLTVLGLL
jgi:hypothetical protein